MTEVFYVFLTLSIIGVSYWYYKTTQAAKEYRQSRASLVSKLSRGEND